MQDCVLLSASWIIRKHTPLSDIPFQEGLHLFHVSFNCHSEMSSFNSPCFWINPFKVPSLGWISVDFLSLSQMNNIFYEKDIFWLFVHFIFFTCGCERCTHLFLITEKKIKVTNINKHEKNLIFYIPKELFRTYY